MCVCVCVCVCVCSLREKESVCDVVYLQLHIRNNVYCQVLFLTLVCDSEVEQRYKNLRDINTVNSGHVFGPNTYREADDQLHRRTNLEKNKILRFVW